MSSCSFLKTEFDDALLVCYSTNFHSKGHARKLVHCQLISFTALVSPQGPVYRLPEKYCFTHKKPSSFLTIFSKPYFHEINKNTVTRK